MQLISKISKGTNMDQIYIPKRRAGFDTGSYVIIKPMRDMRKSGIKPFFHNIHHLEPIKTEIINKIFENIDSIFDKYDNIIITGSFLEKGFNFNDVDVLLIAEDKVDKTYLERLLKNKTGIDIHIILINNRDLIKGLNSDPLYQTMLSKCVSRKRFVYRVKPKINYKILDLHLLKSKLLIDNFDFLNGSEKYEMLRNAVSIALFIKGKKISKDKTDKYIDELFGRDMHMKIRENIILNKKDFLDKYKKFYKNLSSKILSKIKNDSKQK